MKQELDPESINALINYRFNRAKETLLETETLVEKGFYNAAVNRLYYACYYAVIALLVKHQITANTHAGVKQMLGSHFVVTGKLTAKYGRFYSQLFNDRITGDYDDFITYDQEMIDQLFPNANEFIYAIGELLKNED
jgi:uncharacterized protein (UPF0332 family)